MQAPRRLQLRRGNTAAVSTYLGAAGELIVNTDTNTLIVHDGSTVGGIPATTNTAAITSNVSALQSDVAILTANAGAQAGSIATLTGNAAVQAGLIADLTANAGAQAGSIATLTSNAAVQAGLISTLQTDVATLTSNAAAQSGQLADLLANAGIQSGQIADLTSNAAVQAGLIASLNYYTDSNVTAYLATSAQKSFGGNVSIEGNLFVNGNVTYINTESYVTIDNVIQIANGNPDDSLDLGFAGHRTVGGVLQHTGLARDASAGVWRLFSNVASQPGSTIDFTNAVYDELVLGNISSPTIDNITSNLGAVSGSLATLTANAAAQAGLIADLQSNAAVQAGLIANAQGNYSNANVASYLTADTVVIGNLTIPGNILFSGGSTYSDNTFISPTSNGALNKYEWKFSDQAIGNDTITLQWNLLDTTLSQWYLSTNSQTQNFVFDGESQSLGFVGNSGSSGTVTFGATTNNGTGGTNDIELTSATGNAYIRTGSNSWKFNQGGNLTFPDSTVQTTAWTGTVDYTNVTNTPAVYGNSNVSSYLTTYTGNIGNVLTTANVVTTQYFIGNGALLTGIVASAGTTYSNTNVAAYLTTANITTTGNITAAWLSGNISITGNVVGTSPNVTIQAGSYSSTFNNQGNVILPNLAVSGNVSATNFIGNGALLTGIVSGGGTTYSNSNVASYLPTYSGNLSVGGYVGIAGQDGTTVVDFQTGAGTNQIISLASDYTFNIKAGNGAGNRGHLVLESGQNSRVVVHGNGSNVQVTAGNGTVSGTWTFTANGNLTLPSGGAVNYANGVSILTGLGSGSYGNTEVGAYLAGYTGNIGNVKTTANVITTQYFIGNGAFLTGIVASGTTYSNTNVAAYLTTYSGNIGNVTTTANITTSQFFIGNGSQITGISGYSNANVTSYLPTHSGNVGVNNIIGTTPNVTLQANSYSTTYDIYGNVAFGNVLYPVQVYATGNISTSGYLFGNGAFLTGIVSGSSYNQTLNTTDTVRFAELAVGISGALETIIYNDGININGSFALTESSIETFTGNITANFANVSSLTVNGDASVGGMGVTMPNRPAFRIYGNGSTNWTTANTNFKGSGIVVDYNQGSYFNSTTGVFTAPVAGLYSVTLTARIGNNNGQNQIMVIKNNQTSAGNVAVMWECDTNTGTAVHFGVSSVMRLAAGDVLTANITVGAVQFDANDSWTVTYLG